VELRRHAAILWRRKWLILAVTALAVGVTWATTDPKAWQPRYRARATLLVTVPPGQPLPYPIEAIRTTSAAREAIVVSGVEATPREVLRGLTVSLSPGTSLVAVELVHSDPERAAGLANAFADLYLARLAESSQGDPRVLAILQEAHEDLQRQAVRVRRSIRDPAVREEELLWLRVRDEVVARTYSEIAVRGLLGAEGIVQAEMVERATPPAQPEETQLERRARVLGGVGGAALLGAIALAFVLEYLDGRLRNEGDVERALGAPVLTTLPSVGRIRKATRLFAAIPRIRTT
jgi:succinoglycan biosynthesis transport protein ExoP